MSSLGLLLLNGCGVRVTDEEVEAQIDKGCTADKMRPFYIDRDRDGEGSDASAEGESACENPNPDLYTDIAGDCNDQNPQINSAAIESCNNVDDNCDGQVDEENAQGSQSWVFDGDGDRYIALNAATRFFCPGFEEIGFIPTNQQMGAIDCDDENIAIHPDAPELCNLLDDDCDGLVDDDDLGIEAASQSVWYLDFDGDGYGNPDDPNPELSCVMPLGRVDNALDCNDNADFQNPGLPEVCSGRDDNCNGLIDDEDPTVDVNSFFPWFVDGDGDGFGRLGSTVLSQCSQPVGYAQGDDDCNDFDPSVHPLANEVCDGIDNDCLNGADDDDPNVDDSTFISWRPDADGDGFGDQFGAETLSCAQPAGMVDDQTDCDDSYVFAYLGATEICDGFENDCDPNTVTDLNSGVYNAMQDSMSLSSYAPDLDQISYNTHDVLYLCAGTYVGQYHLPKAVTIEGQGLKEETVIDADFLGSGFTVDATCSANSSGDCAIDLSSLTVRNGTGTYNALGMTDVGGGLDMANADRLFLTNVVLEGNSASYGGGVLSPVVGSYDFDGLICQDNIGFYGAGCAFLAGDGQIHNSAFIDNEAYGNGGGIAFDGAVQSVSITQTNFTGNIAWSEGGGIYFEHGATGLTIEGSDFVANTAANGAGLYNDNGMISVLDTSFINNMATDFGGGISSSTGDVTVQSSFPGLSFFLSNDASFGGAIYFGGLLDVIDVDFSANSNDVEVSSGDIYSPLGNGASLSCDDMANPVCQ